MSGDHSAVVICVCDVKGVCITIQAVLTHYCEQSGEKASTDNSWEIPVGHAEMHPRRLQIRANVGKGSENGVGECKELVLWTTWEQEAGFGVSRGPLCRKLAQRG